MCSPGKSVGIHEVLARRGGGCSSLSEDLDPAERQIEGPEHDRGDGSQACADGDGESLLGFEHARSESAGGGPAESKSLLSIYCGAAFLWPTFLFGTRVIAYIAT